MSAVAGTYQDGKVILDTPVDWANGLPVQVSPSANKIGMTEEEWPTTPEGIEAMIKRIDSLEPVELTPEEEADWLASREEIKRYTKQKMNEQEDLFE